MAARSVRITFLNNTPHDLVLTSSKLDHGVWRVQPPKTVAAGRHAQWASESNGVATGTEGSAAFKCADGTGAPAQLVLRWDNPYAGGNSYPVEVPSFLQGDVQGSSGDDSVVVFAVAPK